MAAPGPILDIADVRFRWPGRTSFSLSVGALSLAAGETLLLLGESGSGKSTLLSLICGTIIPNAGRVAVAGTELTSLSGAARDRFRAEHVGVIFQQFNLLPFGNVADNICLPLRFAPERRRRVGDARAEVETLVAALNLPSTIRNAKARNLSVGQQQRVAVARALIGQPPLIIADEPTSALDAGTQAAFLDLLFAQREANGQSLLMVSHDSRLAARFDRAVHMEDIADIEKAAA